MIEAIYGFLGNLTDFEILFFFVSIVDIYAFIIYHLLWVSIGRFALPNDNYFGVTIIGTLTSLNAVMLSFTLVQTINSYNNANLLMQKEISSIELLDKKLILLKSNTSSQIKGHILNYLHCVADHEWQSMKTGIRDPETEKSFQEIMNSVARTASMSNINKEVLSDFLRSFDELVTSRYDRLKVSGQKMPIIFYYAVFLLITIHVMQFFLLTKRAYFSLSILLLHMSALGSLIGLIYIYDNPYEGSTSIKSDNYARLAKRISNIP
jgi:hypothetical protein